MTNKETKNTKSKRQKVLLSGIKPTGTLHLGNYFGAMKQFADLPAEYEKFVFVANYHALTSLKDKEELEKNTFDIVAAYLSAGLDPEKVILFKQSAVPEVTELTWIFNCLVTVPYLERAHAFKDALANGKEATVGLFDYPVLMAADILIYGADVVPVGKDQRQHVEIAREIARKFNITFGELFTEPEEIIKEDVEIVPGTDGRKMSKSYKNTISLFGSDSEIKKAIMSIVTDSVELGSALDPDICNIFALHKLFSGEAELASLAQEYRAGAIGFGESKQRLLAKVLEFITPMRAKYQYYQEHRDEVEEVLAVGGQKARARAREYMDRARDLIGL